ncbi:1-phosphofructokinase [Staphylococcus intermedius]|uniref:Tagatose-6-phosphate kinase n=1 Tax=Staphylococcus intermedius NCTC 11048 TaxID=1141106 RepID=A0A380G8W1_STAIN|nr:1-phosphofructokinase [Staphylococcus intermedius]PCF65491.1 1-phosphofructokinase [Staphylococcus intermedius]PCF81169.1 1-phosphofructokinase [Staphylococcus intermedius]PCF82451.1 1-phosphofructokinase [Staphylococcus intermedius]PCF87151.1 1-phosphofructokinase [Staphylococcus intermedius]PCF87710.1 1-phosphofructokinase [Staphylococcus intermedius]
MIYTVTFNPSIDYVMFVDDFAAGDLNRTTATAKFAGGKGINVSRVLQTLHVPSTALGFIGGFPGQFIENTLKAEGIHTAFTHVDEDTRINVKLKSQAETEINAAGPHITEAQVATLFEQLQATTAEDIVVVAGSVPSSLPDTIYIDIAKITQQTGAKLVADAEKSLIEGILPYHPLFIKPNQHELEAMFDTKIETDQDVLTYARRLVDKGAQSVIVSLGGDGALYADKDVAYKIQAPQGQVVNTVGAGDSTVAGMIAGLSQNLALPDALTLAIASGSATAFNDDLAQFDTIQELQAHVTIQPLNEEG